MFDYFVRIQSILTFTLISLVILSLTMLGMVILKSSGFNLKAEIPLYGLFSHPVAPLFQ